MCMQMLLVLGLNQVSKEHKDVMCNISKLAAVGTEYEYGENHLRP